MTNPALKKNLQSATAFAPATCANVGVGFDILGFAFAGVGDEVTLTRRNDDRVIIEQIEGNAAIPTVATQNVASVVVQALCRDLALTNGFSIAIKKGIPLGSGMGGSAASTVAALVALNTFLETPLTPHELIPYALLGEEVATGHQHYDNIVACLLGGFVLVYGTDPFAVVNLPVPDLHCVIVHPHFRLDTKDARNALSKTVSLKDYVRQSAHLAAFIASLYRNDYELLRQSLQDILIEPARAALIPGFYAVKLAALTAGALGAGLSGSGPSLFAFAANAVDAAAIAQAMSNAFIQQGLSSDHWITHVSTQGAYNKQEFFKS